jgi:hypothetical protein
VESDASVASLVYHILVYVVSRMPCFPATGPPIIRRENVGCGPPGLVLQVAVLVEKTVMVAMAVETILVVAVVRVSTSNGMMSVIVEAGSVISSVTPTAAGVTIMVEQKPW